jgi:hypothetical protein
MKRIAIIIFFGIAICSCNSKSSNKQSDLNAKNNFGDSIIRDIPKWIQEDTFYRRRSVELNQHLGLTSIENGFDKYQVRIWFAYNDKDTQQTVLLKNYDSKWTAEFYYVVLHNDKNGELKYIDKSVQTKIPKSGWQLFIDSLFATGIDTLHDYHQIPDYFGAMDANTITIEIAKPKLYRFYQYSDFDANKRRFTDPAKLEKAITLIKREFDFKRSDNR